MIRVLITFACYGFAAILHGSAHGQTTTESPARTSDWCVASNGNKVAPYTREFLSGRCAKCVSGRWEAAPGDCKHLGEGARPAEVGSGKGSR